MCFGTSSGRLTQLLHFGPLIAIFLIGYITITGYYCLLQWWPPNKNDICSLINFAIYCTWPIIIFYNYFNAIFLGPGFVPDNWKPDNKDDQDNLQYCKLCQAFKAPRSHHCRKCKRCVLKMDHHCPWINTCVGHKNHSSFVYFVLYAPMGCIHAMIVLGPSIYRALFRSYYLHYKINVPDVRLSIYSLVACMFAIGMALGVAIAVSILFIVQMNSIWRNQTGIEGWILKKAKHRRKYLTNLEEFIYPYDLGIKENFRQVFNWSGNLRPIGNGIWWNVRAECDQFTLTREQLSQKEEKREHAVKYTVIEPYNGSFFPISKGCKVCCCIPLNDDSRLAISPNEDVLVTRWQKHWLYGEIKKTDNETENSLMKQEKKCEMPKGWFPARCVVLHEDERRREQEQDQDEYNNVQEKEENTKKTN